MKNRKPTRYILITVIILALAIEACGLNIDLAGTRIKTGPIQTVNIQLLIPVDSSAGVALDLEFAAGELWLAPGPSEYLAFGTAAFNAVDFEPKVETRGASTTLHSGDLEIEVIPNLPEDFKNEWRLQLSDTPMSLSINAAAYSADFELGGLSLETLSITEVGSEVTCSFSEPNQVEMSSFTYTTGGSSMVLKGLANANFGLMNLKAGAGDYTLSFDGVLQRDADVLIDVGAGNVNIIVPEGVNAELTFDSGLSTVELGGEWKQLGDTYSLSSGGPTLTITVKMGAGTLSLANE